MTDEKLRIFMNTNITMSRGKYAAHAVHAALTAFGVHPDIPVVVLGAKPRDIEAMRVSIHDHGTTELAPGTLTAGTDFVPRAIGATADSAALAAQIRAAVQVGHVGPNSTAIIGGGGSVALTPSEAEEAAERMIGWVRDLVQSAAIEAFYDGLAEGARA